MSTAEDGGAAANANTSSYGGGGVGGKFRKKPLRRQATPYDRPPAALRGSNTNSNDSSSWLTKLVVEPASKLISYGADRFFGSVFRRRLPPPPPLPPQPPESNAQESDEDEGEGLNSQGGEQEPGSGQGSQPIISSSSSGVTELEHLLKQKTFTRSEIAHLAELLQSRAAEVSPGEASRMNVVPALDSGRQTEFASSEGNQNDPIRSRSSPVLENDVASPAELAKAYMGSRPSHVSPSVLGIRNQLGKEGTGLLADRASKSPVMSLARRTSGSLGAAENGFVTPRSQGRSAIYTMARTTPYSRVHPTSILKGSGINSSGYAGPSTSWSFPSTLENDGNFDSPAGTLKRRSSVLDDEIGSVGPMRRIRQKPTLLASRSHHTPHGVGFGSLAKQKSQFNGEERNKVLKNSEENENESVPSTSYAHVPTKSKEVAAKILEQLEKLSPKGKSPESKLGAMQEISPSKLMSSRLTGQVLQGMDDVGPSRLLYVQDDPKSGKKTNHALPDVHESSPGKQGNTERNDPNVSVIPSGRWNSVLNNDSGVSLKASTPGLGAADSVLKNGASQPKKKRAFRISAEEDSLALDDVECNGSRSLLENKGPFQSQDKSFQGLTSKSASVPASEGNKSASQSQIFPQSVPAFDKPKEANSPRLFSFSSKAAEKVPSSSESTKRVESEPEKSSSLSSKSSLADISISPGCETRTPESETGFHMNPVKDTNGICDDVSSAALNGPLVSSCSPVSFPAAPSTDNHRLSTASAPLFTSSTSIANFAPTSSGSTSTSTSTTASTLSGWALKGEPVSKFGSAVDLPNTVSTVPTASISGRADQRANIDINPSFGSSTNFYSYVAAAASSGNNIVELGSSFSNSAGNSLQSSIFASATKSPMFGTGTISQDTSDENVSSASVPALTTNTGASFGSFPTPSINFGFTSSTSSSDTPFPVPAGGTTPSLFKFGVTETAASQGFAASSTGATTPIFGFGAASSSAINTTSSFSSGSSGIFGFGGSSPASSSTTSLVSSSNAPSSVFGSGWQSAKSPLFGSPFTSASQSSGFSFSASKNAEAPMSFNSSTGASTGPIFSFAAATTSALSSSPSLPNPQPVFGNPPIGGGFGASPGNDQMNAEDSMAEDPVPSSAPIPPGFGQPSVSPSPSTFAFGSSAPSQNNPFMFNGQQNQVPPQNPSQLGSLEFNAGGSFSLGSTGGDKSGRRMIKINRSKNRKK